MPPQFKRAASTQEQAEQKNQEERNKQLYEQAEAGDLDEVDGLLKKGERPLRASEPRPARLGGARAGPEGCLCSRCMPEAQALPVAGAGAEPDAHRSDNGFTALIVAAVKGHGKVAERLLAAGAELDQQTKVRLARADDSERLPVRRLARAPRARSPLLLRVRRPDPRS